MEEGRFQSYVDHLGWGEGPHSLSPLWEEDCIGNVEGFGRTLPKQERKPKDGAAGEDAQYEMAKGEGVVPYLKRLTQIRDELGAVGSKTEDEELVRIALNGFLSHGTPL